MNGSLLGRIGVFYPVISFFYSLIVYLSFKQDINNKIYNMKLMDFFRRDFLLFDFSYITIKLSTVSFQGTGYWPLNSCRP
jgi:hypothetical protein